jgi:hypothetical protein
MSKPGAAHLSAGGRQAHRLRPLPEGRWMGATLYDPPRACGRSLREALDHLDGVGLCACWCGPRRHQHRRAAA